MKVTETLNAIAFFGMLAFVSVGLTSMVVWAFSGSTPVAHAALPGSKWGEQLELGTVGGSTVYKVSDEALTCLVLQPRSGAAPAMTCWGSP